MEHLHHFGLNQDPFRNEPDLRFYFDGAIHRECQLRVERSLRQNKGLTVLLGDGGTGKTLLARRIFEALEEEVFETNLMVILPGAADAEAVLVRFARQLGVDEPSGDRSGLLAQIYEQMAIVREDGRHAILILDDAHLLSTEAMAEVGGLLNLEYEDRRLLSLLLVGLPELETRLWGDSQLGQRIDVRATLGALDRESAHAYLAHRLTVAGASPGILPGDALAALYDYGHGRPRLMNTLADNALFECHLVGRPQLVRADVERASAELGITANPGETYAAGAGSPAFHAPPAPRAMEPAAAAPAPSSAAEAALDALDGTEDLSAALDPAFDADFETPRDAAGTLDLDAEMAAVLEGEDFGGDSAEMMLDAPLAGEEEEDIEATRMILPDDGLALGGMPSAGPPKQDPDDVDDLFAELIEE